MSRSASKAINTGLCLLGIHTGNGVPGPTGVIARGYDTLSFFDMKMASGSFHAVVERVPLVEMIFVFLIAREEPRSICAGSGCFVSVFEQGARYRNFLDHYLLWRIAALLPRCTW